VRRDYPLDSIAWWSGSIASIPATWRLCDGLYKTPDLRNLFVIGAGDTYAPAAAGGSVDHGHDFVTNGHTHVVVAGTEIDQQMGFLDLSDNVSDTGTTNKSDNLPPYKSLCLIQYKGKVK